MGVPDLVHANLGALSMNITIHDVPVNEAPDFYTKLAAGPLKNYRDIGMDYRDKNYYRAAILGCVRCIDYFVSRPDFNGKDIAVTGGGQGGGLTMAQRNGLDHRGTLAALACRRHVPIIPGGIWPGQQLANELALAR